MSENHIVLGAAGVSGRSLIKALQESGKTVTAVARSEHFSEIEQRSADLLDPDQAMHAVAGASHVYICVGLPYSSKVWQRDWPALMRNVVNACERTGASLIFLDNVYMYGPTPLSHPFDESHPQDPPTRKGKARKQTAEILLEAHREGRVQAVIGRSADFYGPEVTASMLYISVLERMLQGKAPQAIGPLNTPHTYAYVPDNARALIALAEEPSAYGEVWHLPVSKPVTIKEAVAEMNRTLETGFTPSQVPRPILKLMGLFIQPIRELGEMLYQFDEPYIMDDNAFRRKFPGFKATRFQQGIEAMVKSFQK